MELPKCDINHDKEMIRAVNNNDIDKIFKLYCENNYQNYIFDKKNINLFDKNAIYLRFFRGTYYFRFYQAYLRNKHLKKSKILMKYYHPFIFLNGYLGLIYFSLGKINKAIYYLKIIKFKESPYWRHRCLIDCYDDKLKTLYYYLNCRFTYRSYNIKYFIHLIILKK